MDALSETATAPVIPAQAGTQDPPWVLAFTGVTRRGRGSPNLLLTLSLSKDSGQPVESSSKPLAALTPALSQRERGPCPFPFQGEGYTNSV